MATRYTAGGVRINSGFQPGGRVLFGQTRPHLGVDLGTPTGTPMYSNKPLVVERNGFDPGGWGHFVQLKDPVTGQQYRIAHLEKRPDLKVKQTVDAGTLLGHTGNSGRSTGEHLHYEVLNNGKQVDPELYQESTPISFSKNGGTIWTTPAIVDKNRNKPSVGSKEENQKKDGTDKSDPNAQSNDPIGDLLRRKEEERQRQQDQDRSKQGQGQRSNQENRGEPGNRTRDKLTGSPFHRGHDK